MQNQELKAIEFVPKALKTLEVCSAAVKRNGRALEFVPKALKTLEMCQSAVRKRGLALEFVPEALRTTILERVSL